MIAETMAEFERPVTQIDLRLLKTDGFSAARGIAASCIAWIWYQWLLSTPREVMLAKIEPFIEKMHFFQRKSKLLRMRPHADLYLLHIGMFSLPNRALFRLAGNMIDLDSGHEFPDDGHLFAAAWCGMLKNSILGNDADTHRHSIVMAKARHSPSFGAISKPLINSWLKSDWKKFVQAQEGDFNRLWERARKDGTIQKEGRSEIVVTVDRFPVEQKWCWGHCGLAMLALRRGIEVMSDRFWFPPHAFQRFNQLSLDGRASFA